MLTVWSDVMDVRSSMIEEFVEEEKEKFEQQQRREAARVHATRRDALYQKVVFVFAIGHQILQAFQLAVGRGSDVASGGFHAFLGLFCGKYPSSGVAF